MYLDVHKHCHVKFIFMSKWMPRNIFKFEFKNILENIPNEFFNIKKQ